jgi:hypothetical protein
MAILKLYWKKSNFLYIDLLISLFLVVILINYNYHTNLAPETSIMAIQLLVLWYVCRFIFYIFPIISQYTLFLILIVGLIEAIWGLGQLYGYLPSNHALFKTTGSFYNSGPYGGFIALMFPISLHFFLHFSRQKHFLKYFFLSSGIILLLVFPATLSRTAWLSAIVGCTLVISCDTSIMTKVKKAWRINKKAIILFSLIIIIVISSALYGFYHIKKDSASGRFFLWKITTLAIQKEFPRGVGLGGFQNAYAQAQADYFKSGKASEIEKFVAGSPEYAFNEYLKVFLEQGLFGGILFLIITVFIIRGGIKNGQIGAAGCFLALSVFSFASYPYYLWEFLVIWALLGTISISAKRKPKTNNLSEKIKRKINVLGIVSLCLLLTASLFIYYNYQRPYFVAKKEWHKLRPLFTMKAYDNVIADYTQIYTLLNHDPKFVFEYGVALNATDQHLKADSVLLRGLLLSSDPMFYNVKGRNLHAMHKFEESEACYIFSTYLLPERIYPYYLLTKLYADPLNYQPEKMRRAALAVLEEEPKVHSMAINEMRDEVRKILKEKEIAKNE